MSIWTKQIERAPQRKVWAKVSLQKTASIFNEKRLINQFKNTGNRFPG